MQGRVAGLSPRCHTALPGWLCPVMGDNRAKRLQPEIPEHRPHRQQGQTPAPVPSASTLPAWCRESHVERWFFRLHGRAHTPLHPALPGRLWVLSGFRLLGIRHCGDVIVQARGYTLEGAPGAAPNGDGKVGTAWVCSALSPRSRDPLLLPR